MGCYHPIAAWKSSARVQGKYQISFRPGPGFVGVNLPCGQCVGCRLERSRQWAIRCLHESRLYARNCVITLTYSEDHSEYTGNVEVTHFQRFMKRLRKHASPIRIRFFHCGEYGENFSRPHYHACLFNWDFSDKKFWKNTPSSVQYRSATLELLWTYGFSTCSDLSIESAAYIARYCIKKVTGKGSNDHYLGLNPEYVTMSRRPGIGYAHYQKYKKGIFPADSISVNGKDVRPPRYYEVLLEQENPLAADFLRRHRAELVDEDQYLDRLVRSYDREVVKLAQIKSLKRTLEDL